MQVSLLFSDKKALAKSSFTGCKAVMLHHMNNGYKLSTAFPCMASLIYSVQTYLSMKILAGICAYIWYWDLDQAGYVEGKWNIGARDKSY